NVVLRTFFGKVQNHRSRAGVPYFHPASAFCMIALPGDDPRAVRTERDAMHGFLEPFQFNQSRSRLRVPHCRLPRIFKLPAPGDDPRTVGTERSALDRALEPL